MKWAGDLKDDCFLEIKGYTAHAECLGELSCRDIDENGKPEGKPFKIECWFLGVYRNYTPPAKDEDILFHSGEHAGMITSGEMARAIAESILQSKL